MAPAVLESCLALSGSVALRPEPFGALAYHFDNRRLTFLKRPELVRVVESLDGHRPVRAVLADCGIPEDHWPAYGDALNALLEADMLTGAEEPE